MLFTPFKLGRIELKNRIVMSPMTRSRAVGNVPNARIAQYYALRAEAGLIITEGTSPSPDGLGYARIPGVFDRAQIAGWREVTDAVHAKGGRIFIQLMHTGRIGHAANLPKGARVVGPSAIAAPGQMHTDLQGMQPHPTPEAITDVAAVVKEFATAARYAIEAGADGVELHGANGYLIEQFLSGFANQRSDRYGEKIRFAVEVAEACAQAIGGDRVGIRLSPHGKNGGLGTEPDTDATYVALAKELSRVGLAYIHVVDHSAIGGAPVPASLKADLRAAFAGAYILSGGYDRDRAESDLAANKGDLVAFGRPFLSNPSFVRKLRDNLPLTPADPTTFFTPDDKGFLDWPVE